MKKSSVYMPTSVVWNKNKTASVVLSKLKEFTITELLGSYSETRGYTVRGWYNKDNFFNFGEFPSLEEAKEFLEGVHNSF